MSYWIVELQPGCWLAPWDGDPGRTLVKENAREFPSAAVARRALDRARRYREFPTAILIEVSDAE